MLHKKWSSHKNNDFIGLLSSTHDLPPHSRTSTYISYLIVKDVHLYIITVSKRPKPSGARGGIDQRCNHYHYMNDDDQTN